MDSFVPAVSYISIISRSGQAEAERLPRSASLRRVRSRAREDAFAAPRGAGDQALISQNGSCVVMSNSRASSRSNGHVVVSGGAIGTDCSIRQRKCIKCQFALR